MIIHSTTLNTEDKVKQIYGGTTWISHSGYVLRGATSGVVANSATKTSGNDSITLNKNQIPTLTGNTNETGEHHHLVGNTTTDNTVAKEYTSGANNYLRIGAMGRNTSDDGKHSHTVTITNNSQQSVSTIPNYKSVYIWERTA